MRDTQMPPISLGIAMVLCLALSAAARADGGVTSPTIAAGGGAGIAFARVPTPARLAAEEAIYAGAPYLIPPEGPSLFLSDLEARSPQKPRGTSGVALFDFDNDGYLDIYVTNGPGAPNSLYRNLLGDTGRLQFVDVAARAGVTATSQDSGGVCYGDIDNDGFEDLYVTGVGEPNILFHNNGDGTFTDITASAGVGAGSFHHSGCAMGDFNGDGRLDLAVANTYDDWSHRKPSFLFETYPGLEQNQLFVQDGQDGQDERSSGDDDGRRRGGIHFTDVSATSGIQNVAGLPHGSFTWSIAAVDIDQDGATDILWTDVQGGIPLDPSLERGYNRVFKNDGSGHFTDVTREKHLDKFGGWNGLAFGDFNCDGRLDFFSTNLGSWLNPGNFETRWFLGQADGTFSDPGFGALKALPFGWGDVAVDYDNDGDQDILYYGDDDLVNGILMDNPGTVLQNQGCSANFVLDQTALTTDHRFRQVNGVAAGDLDNDGFPDVVTAANFRIVPQPTWFVPLTALGLVTGSPLDGIAALEIVLTRRFNPLYYSLAPFAFEKGDLAIEVNSGGNGNGWVETRLIGSAGLAHGAKSNRDGIGATLWFTPDGGKTVITPVVGGASHASQSSLTAGFGLGHAAKGTLDVLWPGGTRNRLYDIRSGERVKVPEIPCSIAGTWKSFGQYDACVRHAIEDLREARVITRSEGERLAASAHRAFPGRVTPRSPAAGPRSSAPGGGPDGSRAAPG
jgi:hypothetical protein